MAEVVIHVRPAGPGDEEVVRGHAPGLADELLPIVRREAAGYVFLVLASPAPVPEGSGGVGAAGGEDPERSLGHETPQWDAPAWDSPGWTEPDWHHPGWRDPGWTDPGWEAPGWSAPSWETTLPAKGAEAPFGGGGADSPSGGGGPAPAGGPGRVAGFDRERWIISIAGDAPVVPCVVGLVVTDAHPDRSPEKPLHVVRVELSEGYAGLALMQRLRAFLDRFARFNRLDGVVGI
jgi:hypothetical protein